MNAVHFLKLVNLLEVAKYFEPIRRFFVRRAKVGLARIDGYIVPSVRLGLSGW